ncbi:MAG: ATP-binding protein [Acidimicrobiales bacterium]
MLSFSDPAPTLAPDPVVPSVDLDVVFAAMPAAAVIVREVDDVERIVRANEAFCELFGISRTPDQLAGDRWRGRPVRLDDERSTVNGALLVRDANGIEGRHLVTLSDGRVIETDIRRLPGEGSPRVIAFRDVTVREQAEERLRRSNRMLEAVARIEADYLVSEDRESVFTLLLEAVLDLTDSDFGFIGDVLHRPTGEPFIKVHHLTNIAWDDATQALYDSHLSGGLEFGNLDTLFGASLVTGEVVIATDPEHDHRAGGLPPGHPPLDSYLGVPLKVGDDLIGMIGVANRPGGYDEALLEWLAPLLAAATAVFQAYRIDTERQRAEAALTEARDAAVAASRSKSEFVATVSHEMRTPLHALLGLSELLLRGHGLAEGDRRAVRAIHDSASSLSALIGDVLDFSQIEAGRLEIADEPYDVRDVLDHVEALLRPQARARSLTLHVSAAADLPALVLGDRRRLQEVLINLVGNAVKFTEHGGVHVSVVVEAEAPALRFSVTDTGPGIPPDAQARIFEPFDRGASDEAAPGTGLGLSISARLVELLGGRLHLCSEAGRGSTFSFALPLRAAEPTPELDDGRPSPADSSARPSAGRVLVVEDNEVNRLLADTQLRALGYECLLAEGGAAALDVLARTRVDVVLMDLRMPDLDGVETTRRIRAAQHATSSRVPIVAVSASATAQEQIRCLSAGMDDFLPKPVTLDALRAMLERWAPGRPHRDGSASPAEAEPGTGSDRALADFREHLHQLGADDEVGARLIDSFLVELPGRCAALDQAVAEGDLPAIAFAAHALTSSASAVAAWDLRARSARLEDTARRSAPSELALVQELAGQVATTCRTAAEDLAALRHLLDQDVPT